MLDFLHIENIAVAKKLDIEFGNGFNVLTGETGAGKSIIIDSIGALLGAKISKDMIRHGEDRAVVSAFFSNVNSEVYELCDELGVPYDKDDSFTISRSFAVDGKNVIKINSSTATLMQLKAIGSKLINIHGQNENQSFMNKANHIRLLDEYSELDLTVNEFNELYRRLTSLKGEISQLLAENKQKDTMVEILNFQIKEITSAKLKDLQEEEKLNELRNKLKGAEKLVKNVNIVYKALLQNDSGISAVVLIEKAIEALKRLSDVEGSASELADKLADFKYEIEDVAETVKDFSSFEGMENPERQLEAIEDRLALIQRLERKYGATIADIIAFKENAENRLKSFESAEEKIDELKHEYKNIYAKAMEIANELHDKRVKGAKILSNLVKESLEFLDMPKVAFEIDVRVNEKDNAPVLSAFGYDDVEFMVATNPGDALSSMSKIASGGELARIMLALKSAVSDKNGAQTIIFDEIDTGVSGSTSQKIGIKLAKISLESQTFCVTHSAQIAALATNHYFIKKETVDSRAETHVARLNDEERTKEIARIIGGIDLTEKQFAAAEELISQSKIILSEI